MRRTPVLLVGLVAFTAGLVVAWILPIAIAQELSLLRWAYEDGRFVVENPTDHAYLIVGYADSAAGASGEARASIFVGESVFEATADTSYYSYPIKFSPVDHFVRLPPGPVPVGSSPLAYGPCEPPAYCPGPPRCPGCPPVMAEMPFITDMIIVEPWSDSH